MNKLEAAAYLGISERSLERHTAGNRIASRLEPGKTRPVVVYDEAELKRFKLELGEALHRGALERAATVERAAAGGLASSGQGAPGAPSNRMPPDSANPATALATFGGIAGGGNAGLEALAKLFEAMQSQAPGQPVAPASHLGPKLLLTLPECQALTGLSRAVLRAAIDAGDLQAAQIGRAWRVKRAALEAYIEKL